MSGNVHPKTRRPSDSDLRRNPGIGSSKGPTKFGDEDLSRDNTVEGDVANDTTAHGGVDPNQTGRTNR